MTGLGTTMANALLDMVFRNQAFTAITGIKASVHNADPGTSGSNEIVGTTRQDVTFNAASGGNVAVSANVPFTNMPGSDVLYVGYWASDGRFIGSGPNGALKDFTATASDDTFTSAGHGYSDGMSVALLAPSVGSLPSGVSADTIYYVRDSASNTFKLTTSPGGTAINLTADGSGRVRRAQRVATGEIFTILAGSTVGIS
jgi:hypothetical protein